MIVKGATVEQLWDAMREVDRKFKPNANITFKREPERVSANRARFTLTVKNTRGQFGKRNPIKGRRVHALCWHGHGEFFKVLWSIAPEAKIISTLASHTSTSAETGFSDWQEGSMMYPYMASDACECKGGW